MYDNSKTGITNPLLFKFNDTMSSTYSFLVQGVTVGQNYFINSFGLIYLGVKSMTISSSIFSENGSTND